MTDHVPATVLQVDSVQLAYRRGPFTPANKVLHGVSLDIRAGETVGLVGESGSGKSSLARVVLGLEKPDSGTVLFGGQDLTNMRPRERRLAASSLQVVFQDPYSSLNPARTIADSVVEPLRATQPQLSRRELTHEAVEMLAQVGLGPDALSRYPAQFSGGQRQRIGIARALIARPQLVVCDEAVSALDLSVQAQVLNLLADLQRSLNLSYLFIAHDLAVVEFIAHRVAVMEAGRIVEFDTRTNVFESPRDPYTRRLLAAVPDPDPDNRHHTARP